MFLEEWPKVIAHLERFEPEFIVLQCGADSLEGDPITHMRYSPAAHGRAALELAQLAERLGHGRVLALGGGGYNRANLAQAWNAVCESLLQGLATSKSGRASIAGRLRSAQSPRGWEASASRAGPRLLGIARGAFGSSPRRSSKRRRAGSPRRF